MRLSLVTDAWHPQVNGVVTTFSTVVEGLRAQGHVVDVIEPGAYRTVACPGYPEIRLALAGRAVGRRLRAFAPERVHIATEGPLGWAARRYVRRRGWRYTTSLHTRFPEYVRARVPQFPLRWGYAALARFHGDAAVTLVASEGMRGELAARGFDHLNVWRRGVDTRLFTPGAAFDPGLPRPLYLYVGRVAREKNIEAFLELPLAGAKAVVGDGPDRARLERAWPQVVFAGYRRGHDLAAWYASADALVFPSRTDTYGVVMLEALACGTPVAAYPVTGPADIVRPGVTGQLDEDLARAGEGCLSLSRAACAAFAREHDWAAVVGEFLARTVPVTPAAACD